MLHCFYYNAQIEDCQTKENCFIVKYLIAKKIKINKNVCKYKNQKIKLCKFENTELNICKNHVIV